MAESLLTGLVSTFHSMCLWVVILCPAFVS